MSLRLSWRDYEIISSLRNIIKILNLHLNYLNFITVENKIKYPLRGFPSIHPCLHQCSSSPPWSWGSGSSGACCSRTRQLSPVLARRGSSSNQLSFFLISNWIRSIKLKYQSQCYSSTIRRHNSYLEVFVCVRAPGNPCAPLPRTWFAQLWPWSSAAAGSPLGWCSTPCPGCSAAEERRFVMRRWRLKSVTERRMSFQCSISEMLSYWLQAAHLIASLQRTLPFVLCIARWTLVGGQRGIRPPI